MKGTFELIKERIDAVYTGIDKAIEDAEKSASSMEDVSSIMKESSRRLDSIVDDLIGGDLSTLAYIQGLVSMAERYKDSIFGDIIRAHLIEVISTARDTDVIIDHKHDD